MGCTYGSERQHSDIEGAGDHPQGDRETLGVIEGDRLIFLVEGDRVVMRKVGSERLSDILSRRKPWGESGLDFQRRLREEWRKL